MIPKVIHYCWFGNAPKSALIEKCMLTWSTHLPDYTIKEWNENNFAINDTLFVKTAYDKKKWAFVSDYVRAYALFNEGGIYLDTDVSITLSLDSFLTHSAFSGFEKKKSPFTALWGAQAGHAWPKQVLEYYDNTSFSEKTNTRIVTQLLEDNYQVDSNDDSYQVLKDDIHIYPSTHFCVSTPTNYAVHHFEGSWKGERHLSFKEELESIYHLNHLLNNSSATNIVKALVQIDKKNRYLILKSFKIKYVWRFLLGLYK